MLRYRAFSVCLFLVTAACLSSSASAAVVTWDAGAGTGLGDGAGTWSIATANWWNGTSSDVAWSSSGTDTAVFGNGGPGPYIVTVSNSVGVGGITFNSGSLYNISGGSIALSAATPTFTMNATSGTISSILTGSSGLITAGSGLLTLTSQPAYTGTTAISGGTLAIYNATTSTWGLSTAFSGSGTLAIQGAGGSTYGPFSISGTNTGFTGVINITGARLSASSTASLGNPSMIYATSGGQVYVSLASVTFPQPLTISGIGWTEGAGNLGALRVENGATWSGPITLSGNARIASYNGIGNVSGNISGPYQLEIGTGGGSGYTMNLSGSNTYGSTKINSGITVNANSANALSSGSLGMFGGTLNLNGNSFNFADLNGTSGAIQNSSSTATATITVGSDNSSQTYSGTLANGSTQVLNLTLTGSGSLLLNAANTFSGVTTVSGGTLALGNSLALQNSTFSTSGAGLLSFGSLTSDTLGGLQGSNPLSLLNANSAAVALTVGNNNGSTTFPSALTGSGSLVKVGTGTLILNSASSNYTGGTTISGGVLQVGNNSALGSGTISLSGGTLQSANGPTLTNSIVAVGSTTSDLDTPGNNLTLNGNLSGSGNITKTSNYSLNLGGSNSGFSGTFSNNASNTFFSGPNASSSAASWVINAGILANTAAGNQSYGLGSLSGTGGQLGNNIGSSIATYTIGTLNSSTTYSGVIVDSVGSGGTTAIVKTGSGSLTLDGSNTYSAGTTISTGTLQVGDGVVNTGYLSNTGGVLDNSTLAFGNVAAQTYNGNISGAGGLVKLGPGTLMLGGSNTYSYGTTITAGNLAFSATQAIPTGSNSILIKSGAALNVPGPYATVAAWLPTTSPLQTASSGALALTASNNENLNFASPAARNTLALGAAGNQTFSGTITPGSNGYILGGGGGVLTVTSSAFAVPSASGLTINGAVNLATSQSYAGPTVIGAGGSLLLGTAPSTLITTGLSYHLDASVLSSLTMSNGTISAWNDLSGNGVNFTQGTAADQPTYVTGAINGHNVVSFNGSSDQLVASKSSAQQTVFIVNKLNGYNGLGGIYGPTGADFGIRESAANTWQNNPGSANSGDFTYTGAMYINGVLQTSNGAASGAVVLEGVTGTQQNGTADLGDYYPSRYYNGYIGEMLVYSGTLSPTAQQAVTAYLTAKWLSTPAIGNNLLPTTTTINLSASTATFDLGYNNQIINSLTGVVGSTVSVGAGALLTTGGDNTSTTFAGTLTGGGGLVKTGSGAFTLSGTDSYTGTTSINGGSIIQGTSAALSLNTELSITSTAARGLDMAGFAATIDGLSGSGSVGSSSGSPTLTVGNANGTATFNGVIQDTINLVKAGTGTQNLSGTGSYTGSTTISAGVLQLGSSTALQSTTPITVNSTAALGLDLAGNNATVGQISGAGTIGSSTGAPTLTIGNGGGSGAFSGGLTGSGNLVKAGSGTQVLSGANTYTGGTTITGGVLQFGTGATSVPSTPATASIVINGGALATAGPTGLNTAATWLASGKIAANPTGTLALAANESSALNFSGGTLNNLSLGSVGNNTFSGTITPGANGYQLGGGGGNLTVSSNALNAAANLTINGSVYLAAAQSYTGSTTISGGVLRLNGGDSVPVTSGLLYNLNASNASSLTTSGGNVTQINDLSGNGDNFANASSTVTLVSGGTAFNNKSVLSFNGSANSTLTMANSTSPETVFVVEQVTGLNSQNVANMYGFTGNDHDIRVTAGPVIANPGNTGDYTDGIGGAMYVNGMLSAGNVTAGTAQLIEAYAGASGADLPWSSTSLSNYTAYNRGFNGYIGQVLAYSTSLSAAQRQSIEAYLMNEWFGTTTANILPTTTDVNITAAGSGLDIGNANQTIGSLTGVFGSTVTIGYGAVLTVGGNNYSTTFAGTINDQGGLAVTGTGTLTLSGSNTYSGGTAINSSALSVSSDSNLGASSGSLAMNNGLLQITGTNYGTSARQVALNAGGGTVSVQNTSGSATFSQVVSGVGALTKTGPGLLTLGGNNTYAGGTTINAGTLSIGTVVTAGAGGVASPLGTSSNAAANLVFNNGTLQCNGSHPGE